MHLVCLGVVIRIMNLWMEGHYIFRVSHCEKLSISSHLESLHPHVPKEFARKPRSVLEHNRWKATEFRFFLLYAGPVVMLRKIAQEVYQNFLPFSSAIHILCNPASSSKQIDYAHTLLLKFVQHFGELYGKDNIVNNVHSLIHLTDDVKNHGPLDSFSAFPFENFLGIMK